MAIGAMRSPAVMQSSGRGLGNFSKTHPLQSQSINHHCKILPKDTCSHVLSRHKGLVGTKQQVVVVF